MIFILQFPNLDRAWKAAKIMARCDKNNDGRIDQEEFAAYYTTTAAKLLKFQGSRKADNAKKGKKNKQL